MLPKPQRLNRVQVKKVISSGIRLNQPGFSMLYLPSDNTRLSVVVPTAVSRLSSERNRLRRQVYTQAQEIVSQLPDIDSVIMVRGKSQINILPVLKLIPNGKSS